MKAILLSTAITTVSGLIVGLIAHFLIGAEAGKALGGAVLAALFPVVYPKLKESSQERKTRPLVLDFKSFVWTPLNAGAYSTVLWTVATYGYSLVVGAVLVFGVYLFAALRGQPGQLSIGLPELAAIGSMLTTPVTWIVCWVVAGWTGTHVRDRPILVAMSAAVLGFFIVFGVSVTVEYFGPPTYFSQTRDYAFLMLGRLTNLPILLGIAAISARRGTRRRELEYCKYVLKRLPEEQREVIVGLIADEANRLSGARSGAGARA